MNISGVLSNRGSRYIGNVLMKRFYCIWNLYNDNFDLNCTSKVMFQHYDGHEKNLYLNAISCCKGRHLGINAFVINLFSHLIFLK